MSCGHVWLGSLMCIWTTSIRVRTTIYTVSCTAKQNRIQRLKYAREWCDPFLFCYRRFIGFVMGLHEKSDWEATAHLHWQWIGCNSKLKSMMLMSCVCEWECDTKSKIPLGRVWFLEVETTKQCQTFVWKILTVIICLWQWNKNLNLIIYGFWMDFEHKIISELCQSTFISFEMFKLRVHSTRKTS